LKGPKGSSAGGLAAEPSTSSSTTVLNVKLLQRRVLMGLIQVQKAEHAKKPANFN
jgi:hypothetical protein